MLNVLVGVLKLLIEVTDFAPLVIHDSKLRVDILGWNVGDL